MWGLRSNRQKAAQKEDLLDDLYDLDDRLDRFIAQPLHEIWERSLKDRSEHLSPSRESESSRTLKELGIFLQNNEAYLSKKKQGTQKFQSQLSTIFDGQGAARLDFGRLGSYIISLEEENESLRRKIEKHIERTSITDEPDAKAKMPVKSIVTYNDTSEGHGANLEKRQLPVINKEREIESMLCRSEERQASARGKQAVVKDLTETWTSATKGRNSLQLKLDEKNTKQKEKNLKAQTELESHLKTIKEPDEYITALHKKLQETNNKYEQLNEKLQAMEETHKLAKLEIETQNQNIYSIQRKFESEHGRSNSLEHELEREREKRSSLEKRISEQISAIEVLKSERDKRINSLQDQLAEREKYAENYRQKAQSEKETNAIISKKNKQLSMKVIDLETRIETLEGQNSTQEAMYYKLEQSKAELQLQVEKLEQNSNALQGDLTRSNQNNLSLKNNEQRLSERVLNLEKENQATLLQRKTLEENQTLLQADVTNLQKRNVDLGKRMSKLQAETKKQCEANILQLEQKKASSDKTDPLQSELAEQKALFLATQGDLEKEQKRSTLVLMGELADENQKLKELEKEFALIKYEVDRLKSAKVMQVQLYHQSRVGLIKEIDNELKAILKSEIEDETTELSFIECNEAADINLNAPLLVTCINVSGIGTDAANAIKALRLTSKMALVVIHHKDEHALPHQASERVLTGPAFANVGGIYDLAFLSNKGVYTCEMNRQTVKSLVYFLNKEGVKSVRDV